MKHNVLTHRITSTWNFSRYKFPSGRVVDVRVLNCSAFTGYNLRRFV